MLNERYLPVYKYYRDFQAEAKKDGIPFGLAVTRGVGEVKVMRFLLKKTEAFKGENARFAERMLKTMLYAYGGYRISVEGDRDVYIHLKETYAHTGARAFDVDLMTDVYLRPLEVVYEALPEEGEKLMTASADRKGNRIGFDAGGSDRKVTAIKDGDVVFEDETIWHPKLHGDVQYHKDGIADSIDRAVAALGAKPDFIGVSSAGIIVDGEVRLASLFRLIPKENYHEEVSPIYLNLGKKYGCPVKVANDGDVAALAGALGKKNARTLGLAFGTSLAAGYADENAAIRGYLNELAFVPVDLDPEAVVDEWSGDVGVGGQYLSQDGVIRLACESGIVFPENATPAEKLKFVQILAANGDERAKEVFLRMGDYLAYTVMWFMRLYPVDRVVVMGRTVSGLGGEIMLNHAKEVAQSEGVSILLELPDENQRRLGQSYMAALL